jgi:hypothetical protein
MTCLDTAPDLVQENHGDPDDLLAIVQAIFPEARLTARREPADAARRWRALRSDDRRDDGGFDPADAGEGSEISDNGYRHDGLHDAACRLCGRGCGILPGGDVHHPCGFHTPLTTSRHAPGSRSGLNW